MPVVGQISVGDGATFTPSVSNSGVISWSNDKNLPNPASVDIADVVQTAISGVYLPTVGGTVTGNLTVNGTITGNLSGNATTATTATTALSATTATSATNDGNGNVITATYLPLAGGTLTGNTTVSADLSVTGDIFSNDINATGTSTLAGLTVSGATSLAGLSTTGNASVGGDLSATGNITGATVTTTGSANFADLTVTGTSLLTGDVTAQGDVSVTGTTATGDLTATGDSAFNNVAVSGTAALNGTSTAVTPAAEDNSTKIATTAYVQTEIKPIETDVTINDKRISNIEKLLQGNLYDYDTDTDSKYVKTVPNGAMPYASLNEVGGKTLVWNQLEPNPTTVYTSNGLHALTAGTQIIAGHKYYMSCTANGTSGGYTSAELYTRVGTSNVSIIAANHSHGYANIVTSNYSVTSNGTTSGVEGNCWIYVYLDGVDSITNIQLIDLTSLYGAGNEPTTVDEFQQTFPAVWYAYNPGSLLSAGVTEVVSQGKNMLNPAPLFNNLPDTVGYYNDGVWTIVNPNSFSSNTYNKIIYTVPYWYTGQITVSCKKKDSGTTGSGIRLVIYYTDGTSEYVYTNSHREDWTEYIKTSASGKKVATVQSTYNQNIESYLKDVQIEFDTTATSYTPYKAPITYPTPAEIQALEGYGWSVGIYKNDVYVEDVYNKTDFETKKYVQKVGNITLNGSESWTWDSNNALGYTIISNGIITDNTTQTNTYVLSDNPAITDTSWAGRTYYAYTMGMYYGQTRLYCKSSDFTSANDVKTFFTNNPTSVNYVLQTPIETDISAYITDDNLIEVEAGGTLTFPNSNGDDYRIDVPSQETFMVDLQEAI